MKIRFLIIAMFVVAVTGCATRISSNKAPDFTEKITKLYVTIKGSEGSSKFVKSFLTNFNAKLNEKGVAVENYYYDPLSLESDEDLQLKIENYQPNLVMVINQTESRRTINNGFSGGYPGSGGMGWGGSAANTGATFDVKIYRPNSKTPVWRANLKVDGQFGLASTANKITEKLVKKLMDDQLL